MYEKVRSRLRKSEASSTTKAKLRVRARSAARTLISCFLLKQYRGTSSLPNHRTSSLPNHCTSSLPNHHHPFRIIAHHPFRIIIIPSESLSSLPNYVCVQKYCHAKCTTKWPCIRGVQDSQSFLLSIQRYNEKKLALYIKTISVASKMNHVCYEHFLIRPAYETAPTDQQEFSHINLISNTICSLKLTIFYLIMTRPCQPGYQKINTSYFFNNNSQCLCSYLSLV